MLHGTLKSRTHAHAGQGAVVLYWSTSRPRQELCRQGCVIKRLQRGKRGSQVIVQFSFLFFEALAKPATRVSATVLQPTAFVARLPSGKDAANHKH